MTSTTATAHYRLSRCKRLCSARAACPRTSVKSHLTVEPVSASHLEGTLYRRVAAEPGGLASGRRPCPSTSAGQARRFVSRRRAQRDDRGAKLFFGLMPSLPRAVKLVAAGGVVAGAAALAALAANPAVKDEARRLSRLARPLGKRDPAIPVPPPLPPGRVLELPERGEVFVRDSAVSGPAVCGCTAGPSRPTSTSGRSTPSWPATG